ncbi:MAG: hypothetical protein Q7K54_03590 [Candidatus Parcubacteria bacterium]|nr:hypothetical protein [Candidatus Parcubacteria bacterium]
MGRGKTSFISVYNAKKHFPKSGKGWNVERIKYPTMRRGSQVVWAKTFKTKKEADSYASKVRKAGRKI